MEIVSLALSQASRDNSGDDYRAYQRIRPLLMEWGYDPAGPLQFMMRGPERPRSPQDVERVRNAAEKGGAQDQYTYGRVLQDGIGVPQNPREAAMWYHKAAEQGHAFAQFQLGVLYDHGIGVLRDQTEAREWYRKSANQGDADAKANLGYMYLEGEGGPVDLTGAIAMLTSAARKGSLAATGTLATCYDNGQGVERDSAKAFELYLHIASSLDPHPLVPSAQYNVGIAYLNGDGVGRDVIKALSWFERAAAQGHARSRQVLSSLQGTGHKVGGQRLPPGAPF